MYHGECTFHRGVNLCLMMMKLMMMMADAAVVVVASLCCHRHQVQQQAAVGMPIHASPDDILGMGVLEQRNTIVLSSNSDVVQLLLTL